jgi:hypothetical protein
MSYFGPWIELIGILLLLAVPLAILIWLKHLTWFGSSYAATAPDEKTKNFLNISTWIGWGIYIIPGFILLTIWFVYAYILGH